MTFTHNSTGAPFNDARGPLCGIYVSRDSTYLYIGEAELSSVPHVGAHGKGRIVAIPKRTVLALSIGTSEPLDDALARRAGLLDELDVVHHLPHEARAPTCPASKK